MIEVLLAALTTRAKMEDELTKLKELHGERYALIVSALIKQYAFLKATKLPKDMQEMLVDVFTETSVAMLHGLDSRVYAQAKTDAELILNMVHDEAEKIAAKYGKPKAEHGCPECDLIDALDALSKAAKRT